MATIFGTNGNNTLIVEADDLRGLAGDDTYVITNALANNPANAGRTIVITDTEGANRLQFADGLQITSIQFLGGNAIQVTLTNNIRIQVVGANAFTFDIGGNAAAGDATGLIGRSFNQLATDFGVNLVNGAGTTAAPVTIQPGANPVAPPAPPAPANLNFTLTQGVDSGAAFLGGAGTDTYDARPVNLNGVLTPTLDQFDSIDGAGGRDTLIIDTAIDGAFVGVRNIEIVSAAGNVDLGAAAAAAGIDTLVMSQAAASTANISGFNAALTVTGSAQNDTVTLDLTDAGNKTLNLGTGTAQVNVTGVTNAAAGSIVMSFVSADVGNGTGRVTVDGPNGDINAGNANIRFIGSQADQFSVIGSDAAGVLIPAQDRGDFQTVVLGSAGVDTLDTAAGGNLGNVYINAGAGNDTLSATAGAATRHFLVGGAGNDTLNLVTNNASGLVVALAGNDNDTVNVTTNTGRVDVDLGSGDDTVDFSNSTFQANLANGAATNDVVAGGLGRDTLIATAADLVLIDNTLVNAVQSISGFEVLTVSSPLGANLTTSRIQAGLDTVNVTNGTNGRTVTFDAGLASTLNLTNAAQGTISVASAGAGTADQVTIANTAAAAGGASVDVFNGRSITAAGVETLVLNGSGNGTATAQTIGNFTGAGLNFVGSNSFAQALLTNLNATGAISAAGLTGAATLSAEIAGATSVTGSANNDSIVIAGAVAAAVNAGAGNDTVTLTALNGTNSINGTLNGGDGIGDTLRASVTDAAAFSTANGTSAKISGFEQLSILGEAAGSVNTIRLDNLGTTSRVISDGIVTAGPAPTAISVVTNTPGRTAVTAAPEVAVLTGINSLLNGESYTVTTHTGSRTVTGAPAIIESRSFTFDSFTDQVPGSGVSNASFSIAGRTVNLTPQNGGTLTAANIASAIANGTTATGITIGGALNGYTASLNADGISVTFTSTVAGDVTDLTVTNPTGFFGGNNQPSPANVVQTATGGNLTAAQVAQAFAAGVSSAGVTVTNNGTFNYNGVVQNTSDVRFTQTDTPADVTNLSATRTGGIQPTVTVTPGVAGVTAAMEVQTVTFQQLLQGQSVTVAGRTVEATTGTLNAAQVSDAFEAGSNTGVILQANGARVSGVLSGWTVAVSANNATTVFTSTTNGDVPELMQTGTGAPPGGQIILQNLANNGTLELTGPGNGGTHTVEITGAGLNTADVFNLALTAAGATNYGNVGAANIERVNVTSNGTAGAVDTLVLNAASADTVVITGNKGLNLTGALGAVKNLDASGVTAGGVTFAAQANTVTIKGGAGDDVLTGSAGNDSIEAGAGNDMITAGAGSDTIVLGAGSDTVILGETLALNGLDTITGFTAGATGGVNNGDVLDIGVGQDSNGAAAGLSFNTATAAAGVDLSIDSTGGNNTKLFVVVDGQATLNLTNVKAATNNTAASGEILVADGASQYILHAASDASGTANLYRVFDSDAGAGITASVELIATVSMTNTVGALVTANFV